MKVILYMTISLNGIIARENNEEDFNSDDSWKTFVDLIHETGCVIWGRKTMEVVSGWEKFYTDQIKDVKKIILSSKKIEFGENCEMADSPEQALKILEDLGYKKVILCGGSINNSSFAQKNLIDEIIFNVEPVVIGKGIPVFKPEEFDLNLEFEDIKKITNNLIQLKYKVKK